MDFHLAKLTWKWNDISPISDPCFKGFADLGYFSSATVQLTAEFDPLFVKPLHMH